MKRTKIISLSLMITMLFVPFTFMSQVSGVKPSFVSLSEGQEIIWQFEFNRDSLESFITDVNDAANDLIDFINQEPDGLKDTIEDMIPSQYLSMDLANAITEGIANITSDCDLLPSGWVDMNASMIIAEIINKTLPEGLLPESWIQDLLTPEVISILIENITSGMLGEGWTNLNISAFINQILDTYLTDLLFEDGWIDSYNISKLFSVLAENLTVVLSSNPAFDGWLDFNLTTLIMTVLENVSNTFLPFGLLDMDFKTAYNTLLTSGYMQEEWLELNLSRYYGVIIANLTSGFMPDGWLDMTYTEITDLYLGMLDGLIDQGWIELLRCIIDAYQFISMQNLAYFIYSFSGESSPYEWLALFEDMTYQEILDFMIYSSGHLEVQEDSGNISYIASSYGFVVNQLIDVALEGQTIKIYHDGIWDSFIIENIYPNIPSAGSTTIEIDSTGLTQTLIEMGINGGETFRIYSTYDSPMLNIPVGELINMSLDEIVIDQPYGFLLGGGLINSISNDYNFTCYSNLYNQSLIGGVVVINGSTNSGIYDVVDVINNGSSLIIVVESGGSPVNLTDLGYQAGDQYTFYTRPIKFSSWSISEIFGEFLDYAFIFLGNSSIQDVMDMIIGILPMLTNASYIFELYGITPPADILNASISELIHFFIDMYNKPMYYYPEYYTSLTVISIDGDYNFTTEANPANDTWDGSLALLFGGFAYSRVDEVIDNGNNITVVLEPMAQTLTELGLTPYGSSVMLYGDLVPRLLNGFDLQNLTLQTLINMIPGLNYTLPDTIVQIITGPLAEQNDSFMLLYIQTLLVNATFREFVQQMVSLYEQTINGAGIVPGPGYGGTLFDTLINDYTFNLTVFIPDPECNVYDGGTVNIYGYGTYDIFNVFDVAGTTYVEIVNNPANNLTGSGIPYGHDILLRAPSSALFEFNLTTWTLTELIDYSITLLNDTLGPLIETFNNFMTDPANGLTAFLDFIDSFKLFGTNYYLKVKINDIGDEFELYPYGPKAAQINVSTSFSPDTMANWYDIPLWSSIYVIDPTSDMPGKWMTTLGYQIGTVYGLIMANSYEWTILNSVLDLPSLAINLPGKTLLSDLNSMGFAVSWTDSGLLNSGEIKYGGTTAAKFSLYSETLPPQLGLIDGFDIAIITGIITFSGIGLIYVVMKKKKSL